VLAFLGEAVAIRTIEARGGFFLAGIGNACRQPGKRLLAPESMGSASLSSRARNRENGLPAPESPRSTPGVFPEQDFRRD
jgi:hypothetical protein